VAEVLIAAAAAGDQHAWDTLVDRLAQHVWDTARDSVLDVAAAEAVSQLCWMRLADHLDESRLDGLRTETDVRTWLRTAVHREARAIADGDRPRSVPDRPGCGRRPRSAQLPRRYGPARSSPSDPPDAGRGGVTA
jgi:DNA-directed RNA polymerase specialized sigma24 family protein